jgi:PRC-barrel domain
MDHTMHTQLASVELNEANLVGASIYGPSDEKIGAVAHVHGVGLATKVIVDVGGFLGIGSKPVALDVNQLTFMRDADGDVHATTTWTKEQVKALPEHHHA